MGKATTITVELVDESIEKSNDALAEEFHGKSIAKATEKRS
jgi:hypothetical protein